MGDMAIEFKMLNEFKNLKRQEKEEKLMLLVEEKLISRGWDVSSGPDSKSFMVYSPKGRKYNYWPYSGYFAGKTQGRGFANLLTAGED